MCTVYMYYVKVQCSTLIMNTHRHTLLKYKFIIQCDNKQIDCIILAYIGVVTFNVV